MSATVPQASHFNRDLQAERQQPHPRIQETQPPPNTGRAPTDATGPERPPAEPSLLISACLGLFTMITVYVMVRTSKFQDTSDMLRDSANSPVIMLLQVVMIYTLEKTRLIIPVDFAVRVMEIVLRWFLSLAYTLVIAMLKGVLSMVCGTLAKTVAWTATASFQRFVLRQPLDNTPSQLIRNVAGTLSGALGAILLHRTLGRAAWIVAVAQAFQVFSGKSWSSVMTWTTMMGFVAWLRVLQPLLELGQYAGIFRKGTWDVLHTDPPQPMITLGVAVALLIGQRTTHEGFGRVLRDLGGSVHKIMGAGFEGLARGLGGRSAS